MAQETHTHTAVGFDKAVRDACIAVVEGHDDVKIEFELAGIKWRLRVEAVGLSSSPFSDPEED